MNNEQVNFLLGGGETGKLIAQKNWSLTPLGDIKNWPQSLKTTVSICLNSHFPVLICWGENLVKIYNDAYRQIAGNRHPGILGAQGKEGWGEVWDIIEPMLLSVLKEGKSIVAENQPYVIDRNGFQETCYFTFSHSPIYVESGKIGGVFTIVKETTQTVTNEKELQAFINEQENVAEQINIRKKAEESEERLRMAIESTRLGTWDFNPITGELSWSEECKRIYGLPAGKEIDFSVFSEHIHSDDREYVEAEIQKSMDASGDGHYDIIYRILRFDDGGARWIRAQGKVYFNSSRQAERFIGTVIDITEQKNALLELEESEKRFKTVADTAPVMIWMIGADKQNYFFNKGWLDFTGRTLEQEIGDGWTKNVYPDDLIICQPLFNAAFEAHEKIAIEYRLRRFDGQYRWVVDHGIPRYSPEGTFLGYIGSCIDIHERKTAKEELEKKVTERTAELNKRNVELQQQRDFAETVLDASIDIVLVYDSNMRFIALNRQCEIKYGLKKEDVLGKHILEIFPGAEGSKGYDDLSRALNGEIIHNTQYKSPVDNYYYENFLIPLRSPQNEIYAVLVVAHDITDSIEKEEQLKQANEELLKSNRDLEQFAYIASHDLQEPLRKIQTFSELVQKHWQNEETAKKYFAKIISSSQRMAELIKAVLNYSRLSKNGEAFEKTDLNTLIENVKTDFELLIAEKNAVIICDELPVINGIPLQLNQLFSNLISNSLKFSENKPEIRITSKILSEEEIKSYHYLDVSKKYVQLKFVDNGIGFEQKFAEQIFTIFQRLHDKQTYTGTGIGLALCKKIVENHHGYIGARSELGEGSTFYIYLPI